MAEAVAPARPLDDPQVAARAKITARIERIPYSRFHVKARMIVGTATLFDAFDAMALAYILPVLVPLWKLSPMKTGTLISVGYFGQLFGALFFGWLAERKGRILALQLSIAVFGIFSLLCIVSPIYTFLFIVRFIQGIGLGGEIPIAAAYITEISKAKGRGRFVMLYEWIFNLGLFAGALLGNIVVVNLGWRVMFLIGALPALLILPIRRSLPESPRWLANQGRLEDADRVVTAIEKDASKNGKVQLPPVPEAPLVVHTRTRLGELLEGIYLRRTLTVWVIWFVTYLANFGMTTWLPTLYRTVYKLPLNQALRYALITQSFGLVAAPLCAFLIDRTGRKAWFSGALAICGVLLVWLWWTGARDGLTVLLFITPAYMCLSSVSIGLYLYSPELYPTRLRAIGVSVGTGWLRLASIIGPLFIGFIVAGYPLSTAFLVIGIVVLIGAAITAAFAVETKRRVLEEVSP